MPRSRSEYKARWIWTASALGAAVRPCWSIQYCITMAILAAPHPFFSCLTKGTSSHSPDGSAATTRLQRHNISASVTEKYRVMRSVLSDCNNDQNQCRDTQYDEKQIPVTQSTCCEVSLSLVGSRSQLSQFCITQRRDSGFHLFRIHVHGLKSLLRHFG